jgi:alkaline phosphatase D
MPGRSTRGRPGARRQRCAALGCIALAFAISCSNAIRNTDIDAAIDNPALAQRHRPRSKQRVPGDAGEAGDAGTAPDAAAADGGVPIDCRRYALRAEREEPDAPPPIVATEPTQPPAGEARWSAGPIVGAVSDRGVKIWVRADRASTWTLRYWDDSDPGSHFELDGPPLSAASDFSGTVRLSALKPGHAYTYQALLEDGDGGEAASAGGHFHTLTAAGQPARTRIAVAADITGAGPQPIFEQLAGVDPDFALFIGDQIYADDAPPTFEGFADHYRHNWNIKYLRALLRIVPAFMIWDDHDIQDNFWPGKSDRYAPARQAYEIYVQGHNPAALRRGELYYTLRSGDVALFVLDVRSHRSPDDAPDGAAKTMLGAQQKRDLLSWLACEPARLKIIVSPVVWNDWSTTGPDAWLSYADERDQVLGFIATRTRAPVILVSGDQHWSAVFRFVRHGYTFYEFLPTPVSKNRASAYAGPSDEILARDDDNFVFGVLDIDTRLEPPQVALTLCAQGKPCQPGEEPEPTTGLDVMGDAEDVPFTVRLGGALFDARQAPGP